jgi:hypothetical protein
MRSGSVNVIFITLANFTLPSHFYLLFEALTAVEYRRRVASNSQ